MSRPPSPLTNAVPPQSKIMAREMNAAPRQPSATPAASQGARPEAAASDRRRSQRVLLVLNVDVTWVSKDGIRVRESAETEVVSQHGAMLKMETKLSIGSQLELTRSSIGKAVKARVVGTSNPGQDGMARVAVELSLPSDNFWGITFPPLS